jgi:hypothetical protein
MTAHQSKKKRFFEALRKQRQLIKVNIFVSNFSICCRVALLQLEFFINLESTATVLDHNGYVFVCVRTCVRAFLVRAFACAYENYLT